MTNHSSLINVSLPLFIFGLVNSVSKNDDIVIYVFIILLIYLDLLYDGFNIIHTIVIQLKHNHKCITLTNPLIMHYLIFTLSTSVYDFHTISSTSDLNIWFIKLLITSWKIFFIEIPIHIFTT